MIVTLLWISALMRIAIYGTVLVLCVKHCYYWPVPFIALLGLGAAISFLPADIQNIARLIFGNLLVCAFVYVVIRSEQEQRRR